MFAHLGSPAHPVERFWGVFERLRPIVSKVSGRAKTGLHGGSAPPVRDPLVPVIAIESFQRNGRCRAAQIAIRVFGVTPMNHARSRAVKMVEKVNHISEEALKIER